MARKTDEVTERRRHWADEMSKADKRFNAFMLEGDLTVRRYKLEQENAKRLYKDRYNILYSSTETIIPSLYAQTPKAMTTRRHKDRNNPVALAASMLMESITQYALEEVDFDGVMKNCVKDYSLPGIGLAWVRYSPTFKDATDATGAPVIGEDKKPEQVVDFDGLDLDYVYWKDFRCGFARVWAEVPWISRDVYFNKKQATERFGKEKANKLAYSFRAQDRNRTSEDGDTQQQACIREIWDIRTREVHWYSVDCPDDLLDSQSDPLKLKNFWPTPEPMRAVWATDTFIPQSFHSQYRAQADELDSLTSKIRQLTDALRVIGVYDGSNEKLQNLLAGTSNKMVPVDNWMQFVGTGGVTGSIQWVPIKDVAVVLTELFRQREIVKAEIYEITGFSDVVRGVSKASETLGAQQIKQDWASARLRAMQMEVQRYCRDIMRIMCEIMCEHFSDESLAVYGGFDLPTPERGMGDNGGPPMSPPAPPAPPQQSGMPPQPGQPPMAAPAPPPPDPAAQAYEAFKSVVELLRNEKERCATVGVETDSTLLPDEQKERADRLEFLGQIGAFMQQAGPMAIQYPQMQGLLGAIMMFAVRTFRSSRPLEQAFEEFTKQMEMNPPKPPQKEGEGGDGGKAAAEAKVQETQMKTQADAQKSQQDDATKRYEIDQHTAIERERMTNEHEFRMAQLAQKERELDLRAEELSIDRAKVTAEAERADRGEDREDERLDQGADQQVHQHEMDRQEGERADEALDAPEEGSEGKKDA